jgi:uncharacterized protein (TIGR02996 family)
VAVYFGYRCGYLGPTTLYRRRFDDATVLDWFRRHWVGVADENEAIAHAKAVLGEDIAYFACVFLTIARRNLPLPTTTEEIARTIQSGYHNAILFEDHCVQVLTDDDEIDMAYYFFDDAFLQSQSDLASYLLLDDWRLPDGMGKGGWWPPTSHPLGERVPGENPGRLYAFWRDLHDGEHLGDSSDVDVAEYVEGVRVGDLCRWLMTVEESFAETCGFYFLELSGLLLQDDLGETDEERAFLTALRADPADDLTWGVYADWLAERGLRAPGYRLLERALPRINAGTSSSDSARNLFQVGDHVVQLFAYCGDDYRFDHWFLFDDLWGSANPELAGALVRYGCRWDVLSTGDERRLD